MICDFCSISFCYLSIMICDFCSISFCYLSFMICDFCSISFCYLSIMICDFCSISFCYLSIMICDFCSISLFYVTMFYSVLAAALCPLSCPSWSPWSSLSFSYCLEIFTFSRCIIYVYNKNVLTKMTIAKIARRRLTTLWLHLPAAL